MNLTQEQKDFLEQALSQSTTSGELLDRILGAANGGTGPGLPGTVSPPGPRGYLLDCAEYMSSLPSNTIVEQSIIRGIL